MQKRVLVVDDEQIITSQMERILAREGYQPFIASDGIEAIKFLKENSVDLILTDSQMTILDGLYLVTIITGVFEHRREENAQEYFGGDIQAYDAFVERHKSTPILLMSKDPDIVGRTAKEVGALGCFPKSYDRSQPFNEAQLVETLKQYLSA